MKNVERKVRQFLEERDWNNLRPSDIAKSIVIEAAELLELFQWENRELSAVKQDKQKVEQVKKELADVLIYALQMVVLLGLDTEKIIKEKLARAAEKYPAALMKKNAKLAAGSGEDKEYWRIKRAYRRAGK